MPFKFLPKLSKTSDLDVKLVILYIKIPDTQQLGRTVPEKWTCILWYVLRDWNSRPDYLIVIHNLTLY